MNQDAHNFSGAVIGVVALALNGAPCGGVTISPPTSAAAAAAAKPDPVKACLQLQAWQLANNGQGISAALGDQPLTETHGIALGTDIAQWENDLATTARDTRTGNYGTLGPLGLASQLLGDAQQVAADCAGYGVRHTLGSS